MNSSSKQVSSKKIDPQRLEDCFQLMGRGAARDLQLGRLFSVEYLLPACNRVKDQVGLKEFLDARNLYKKGPSAGGGADKTRETYGHLVTNAVAILDNECRGRDNKAYETKVRFELLSLYEAGKKDLIAKRYTFSSTRGYLGIKLAREIHGDEAWEEYNSSKRASARRIYHIRKLAKNVIKSVRDRAKKQGVLCDLDEQWFVEQIRISKGFCQLSGLPLELLSPTEKLDSHLRLPFSPSIDRIIPGGDYLKGQVRIICHILNLPLNNDGGFALLGLFEQYHAGLFPQRFKELVANSKPNALSSIMVTDLEGFYV